MPQHQSPRAAFRQSLRAAQSIVRWARSLTVLGFLPLCVVTVVFGTRSWILVWLFASYFIAMAGTALGVLIATRRPRRLLRRLSPAEAVRELLRYSEHSDAGVRGVAASLMRDVDRDATEVVAASLPDGRGSELADAQAEGSPS
jgi:hypothetical protein